VLRAAGRALVLDGAVSAAEQTGWLSARHTPMLLTEDPNGDKEIAEDAYVTMSICRHL
jgi:hypothetical protein